MRMSEKCRNYNNNNSDNPFTARRNDEIKMEKKENQIQ